jgi:vesicle-fusing ATPase
MTSTKSSSSMKLTVGNLPANRLALTNKVYVSPGAYSALLGSSRPTEGGLLVRIAPSHPYSCEQHPQVPDGQIALNGLQRRFLQLSLGTTVSLKPFPPPSNFCAASLEFAVDTLAKKVGAPKGKPREIDSERLAADVLTNYENQPMEVGRVIAMDFEGTKLELTVKAIGNMELDSGGGKYAGQGQLLSPTELMFSRAEGAMGLALTGSKVAGGQKANNIFLSDFDFEKLGIGGLDSEFNQIFRRAFASRIWPPHIIKQMGINHVRGMLLFGPPGCGKTLIARQIGKVLNAREPKIVNGPEILNKFVGGSEEKIRELFADAEKEQAEVGDQSMLHIVIMDEMDAICKQRGSSRDGTGVSDSVVNQLLSKIDGVDSLNNILLIGMTNRKDMIDDALLRPGRLEVHVEIGLPDLKGRIQILNIHTRNMYENKRVEKEVMDRLPELAEKSKNFSGAELEGLVKAASSYALTRCVDVKDLSKAPDDKALILQWADFELALEDVEPKFGAKTNELEAYYRNGIVPYDDGFDNLMSTMQRLVEQGTWNNCLHLKVVTVISETFALTNHRCPFPFSSNVCQDTIDERAAQGSDQLWKDSIGCQSCGRVGFPIHQNDQCRRNDRWI